LLYTSTAVAWSVDLTVKVLFYKKL
jgi:hypothetical protein